MILREVYDTLKASVQLNVTGESKKNVSISSTDLGSFYEAIEASTNELRSLKDDETQLVIANILVLVMLGAAGFLYFKKIDG